MSIVITEQNNNLNVVNPQVSNIDINNETLSITVNEIDSKTIEIIESDNTIEIYSAFGTRNHGQLLGLSDDDHLQYHTDSRADTWLATKTTDNLLEGATNLYDKIVALTAGSNISISGTYPTFTISADDQGGDVSSVNGQTGDVVLDTDNINEGVNNLYYTSARFDSAFSAKTTNDLTEGSNLYYTDARAITALTGQNISIFNNDSGYITSADFETNTRDNILASTPADGEPNYATDVSRFYIGFDGGWYVNPIPFPLDDQTGVNIGIQQDFVTRYNALYVTDLDVANCNLDGCIVRDTDRTNNGMIRSVDLGNDQRQLQFYSDGEWRAVLTGIRLREDDSVLEFQPFGTDFWIEAHTGNSNAIGLNGRPIIQAYEVDIGANPARRIYSGEYFDGTNFGDW